MREWCETDDLWRETEDVCSIRELHRALFVYGVVNYIEICKDPERKEAYWKQMREMTERGRELGIIWRWDKEK